MTAHATQNTLIRTLRDDTAEAVAADVAAVVRRGGVVAMPTDSLYALGADPFSKLAVRRVCAIKGGRDDKPILVLIADRSQLAALATRIPSAAALLMDRFWPGPLTIILPASPHLPVALTAGTGTVGVRWPAQPLVAKLLRAAGPLTGTSANRSGAAPARTALDVARGLGGDVDLIVDGGPSPVVSPSTVVEASDTTVRVLRKGPIGQPALATALAETGIELT